MVEAAKDADLLIFVVPHQFVRTICSTLLGKIKPTAAALSLIKVRACVNRDDTNLRYMYSKISYFAQYLKIIHNLLNNNKYYVPTVLNMKNENVIYNVVIKTWPIIGTKNIKAKVCSATSNYAFLYTQNGFSCFDRNIYGTNLLSYF